MAKTWKDFQKYFMALIERSDSFKGISLAMRYEEFKRYSEAILLDYGQDTPEMFFAYLHLRLSCDN